VTPPPREPASERSRILLVEADAGDAELVQLWLRSARETRYDIWHVETLGDAEGCLAKEEFELALVDLALPDAPGPWAVESLLERHPELPVIVFSSFSESEVGARLLSQGARDHLIKGQMSGDTLIRAMRHGVEYGRLARELSAARGRVADSSSDRSELVAELAQELRTPIHTVLGMADLLLETELTKEQEGYVRSFLRASESLLGRVDGLLGRDASGGELAGERTLPPGGVLPAAGPEMGGDGSLRILVVDDSAEPREATAEVLRGAGYLVETAADGCAAEAMFRDGDFEVVLMDIQMPERNGLKATRVIRYFEAEAGRPPVPILALTGSESPEDIRACLDAGCDDHLVKPVRPEALLAAVSRHAPKHRGRLLRVDGASLEEIELYLHERHNDLAGLRFALEAGDLDSVRTVAHALEISGLSQGFAELAELGRTLQAAANDDDLPGLGRGVSDLADFLREVKIVVG